LKERKLEPHLTVTEILSTLIGSDLACKVISYEESYEMLCDEIRSEKLSAEQQQKLNVDILQLNTGKRISDELINAICEKKIRTLDDDHFIGKCPFAVRVVMDSFLSRLKSDPNIKHNLEDRLGSLNQTIPERWQKFIGEQKSEPAIETIGQNKDFKLTFYRVNKTWRIGFSEIKNIPHTKGLFYYQYLFFNPNKYFSGLDLNILGNKQDLNYLAGSNLVDDGPGYDGNNQKYGTTYYQSTQGSEANMDSDGLKKELKERWYAYKQSEEEGSFDVDILKNEYDELKKIYNSLYDMAGELRDDAAPQKKAIKAVAKNLKTAKENILEHLPELEKLLKDVKTGNSFGYVPTNSDKPIEVITEDQK
jgi:hypothetical protein